MRQSDNKREMAKILYVKNGYTQAQIADMVEVSLPTVNRWAKQYNWKQLKATQVIGKTETLQRFYEQINSRYMPKYRHALKASDMWTIKRRTSLAN